MVANYLILTSKQKKVYSAIESYIKQKGIPPTVREIGEMVGEKTPGAVQGILNRLEQKGVIKRQLGIARSIQLVSSDSNLYANPVYIPELKKINDRNANDLLNMYNIIKYHPVSPDFTDPKENCFLIKCPDNSFSDSGITYDDMLLINMDADIRDGDIILIIYDGHTLLRRYYASSQAGAVVLKADTNLLDKEVFNKNEFRIIGRLKAKLTWY